jgi:SAM-dependent methyltransferase
VILGDQFSLYKILAESAGLTSTELAAKANLNERYIREWLACQAASGYIEYDATNESFSMSAEQKAVLADENSPYYMAGGYLGLDSVYASLPRLAKGFRDGGGLGWGDHSTCFFCGTEKFFKPTYENFLVADWIPALDGVAAKLNAGAKVADVGCGHGASTIILGKAFPKSHFIGYDFHTPSVECARERATSQGVTNVTFEVATAKSFPGNDYDLIGCFDCLHDMGDPVGAIAYMQKALKKDGTLMVVEPRAGDTLAENLNPVGRVYYAYSTLICVPTSMDQEVGAALGAQAGEKKLTEVIKLGGFTKVRRAAETPFSIVLEARL